MVFGLQEVHHKGFGGLPTEKLGHKEVEQQLILSILFIMQMVFGLQEVQAITCGIFLLLWLI
jgi:hypothetical protein